MRVDFTLASARELEEAVAHYTAITIELGQAFAAEAEAATERISAYPLAWPKVGKLERRFRLERFPYGLVYTVEGDIALVLAVMHLHRKPGYWRERNPTG